MTATKEQRAVIEAKESIFVSANPGTGKSTSLAEGISHKIKQGVPPGTILTVSFSRTAAKEIRERLETSLPPSTYRSIRIATIHSLAYEILRHHAHELGIDKPIKVKPEGFSLALLVDHAIATGTYYGTEELVRLSTQVAKAKARGMDPRELPQDVKTAWRVLEEGGIKQGSCTFEDILYYAYRLLKTKESVRTTVQARYRVCYIDEAQDTTRLQIDLLDLVCGPGCQIIVLGDIKQTLYRFNGADPLYLIQWVEKRGLKVMSLNETFRFGSAVAKFSWNMVPHMRLPAQYTQRTVTQPTKQTKVVAHEVSSQEEYLAVIVEGVKKATAGGRPLAECAVLYRMNKMAVALQDAFRKAGIKVHMGGEAFTSRTEVKVVLAAIALTRAYDREDLIQVAKTLKISIDKETIERIEAGYATAHKSAPTNTLQLLRFAYGATLQMVGQVRKDGIIELGRRLGAVDRIITQSAAAMCVAIARALELDRCAFWHKPIPGSDGDPGLEREEMIEALDELVGDEEGGIYAMVDHLRLDPMEKDQGGDKVYLGTYHSAKGMTLPVVYMILDSMLEGSVGYYTSETSTQKAEALRDEWFLAFVGATRARDELHIVGTERSRWNAGVRELFGWAKEAR